MVSSKGGFSSSFAEEDEGAIDSSSAGTDWLVFSGIELDFWLFKPAATVEEGALGTCGSSVTSFWSWLDV